jgi:predicted DNA-binding transcriptional regulator AlpA
MNPEFLRTAAVCARYGISRSTLYARMGDGFPKPIHLLGGRCAVWKVSELAAYEDACVARRGDAHV